MCSIQTLIIYKRYVMAVAFVDHARGECEVYQETSAVRSAANVELWIHKHQGSKELCLSARDGYKLLFFYHLSAKEHHPRHLFWLWMQGVGRTVLIPWEETKHYCMLLQYAVAEEHRIRPRGFSLMLLRITGLLFFNHNCDSLYFIIHLASVLFFFFQTLYYTHRKTLSLLVWLLYSSLLKKR